MNNRLNRLAIKSCQGFTLVETVASLLILGMMLCLGVVSFNKTLTRYRLRNATSEIRERIFYARIRSAFEGTPFRLRFERRGFAVERFDEEKNAWKISEIHALEGVSIKANNSPTFHPQGTVSDLATIFVSNAVGRYKITLAISGRVNVVKIQEVP